ncbi:hypothetical protein SAMN05428987_0207 [Paenibacillus sp. CF095]|uniref:hypothetical protein n=1 Tax=Paenibacillus sp. CF095 TaxID=1881033 RepID=UPI0008876178|nr:hypothetical protein [Paenibacillus sp. CF095]SDE01816.1 hypothetical protein SAMN05428987_0207 [Paenibacillus sp. CF095]
MSSIKPLEQIIEDEKALRLLETVGEFFQYAESYRTILDNLTIMLRDIILEPYRYEGPFNAGIELVRGLDRLALGRDTKEEFVEFVENWKKKHN